jgi:hypothetical protein
MPFISTNSFVGLGIEGTRGTASSNIKWLPVTTPQVTPMQTFLRDEAFRGSPTTVYGQVAGVRHDEYDAKFYLYSDTFPLLMKALLGTETKTGSSAPYSHKMQLLNDATTGSQPPSVTIQDFDGQQAFQMLAGQMSELRLAFGAEAAVEATTKFMANPFTTISTPSGTSFGTNTFVPGWDLTMSIAGTSFGVVVDGEINLVRNTAPIFTAGQQAPYRNFAGPLEVSGRVKTVVEATSPFLITQGSGPSQLALLQSTQAVVFTLTDPATTYTHTFTMSQVQFHDAKRDRSKSFVEVDVQFTAQANTTDAATGYSPIQYTGQNAVSSTY